VGWSPIKPQKGGLKDAEKRVWCSDTPAAPLTREDVLPIAARIYSASLNGRLPELDPTKVDRESAVLHPIELAREVDRQLREP
jgi:hypothetical protein